MQRRREFPEEGDYFSVKGGLENLLRRLKKGWKVKGRIVECLGNDRYLLRIQGYNILTESSRLFRRFEEVELKVREVDPQLVLDLVGVNERDPAFKFKRTGATEESGVDIVL